MSQLISPRVSLVTTTITSVLLCTAFLTFYTTTSTPPRKAVVAVETNDPAVIQAAEATTQPELKRNPARKRGTRPAD